MMIQIDEEPVTLAAAPRRTGGKKKSMSSKTRHVLGASLPNGNASADEELQVEIFFLIIGHP